MKFGNEEKNLEICKTSNVATETQETLEAKEKRKALDLEATTDDQTIPVTKVPLPELGGVTAHPWDTCWDHKATDLRAPVILERSMNVIGGPLQYFEAEESGQKEIDAVYIDSLASKDITLDSIKRQFVDPDISMSFAYLLYACVSSIQDIISYEEFCEAPEVFESINDRILNYVEELDRYFGE